MEKRLFQKTGVDICSAKSMFNFINEHYQYYTLNSWNNLKSIANNVKLYNLKLEGDWGTACSYLFDEYDIGNLQEEISDMIRDWEDEHPGYGLGFNGRSGGYLVIYNHDKKNGTVNFRSILPEWLTGFDTYEEWKDYILDYYAYAIKDMIPELREYTKLIRDFDKLCDDLRDLVNEYSKLDYEAEKFAAEVE